MVMGNAVLAAMPMSSVPPRTPIGYSCIGALLGWVTHFTSQTRNVTPNPTEQHPGRHAEAVHSPIPTRNSVPDLKGQRCRVD